MKKKKERVPGYRTERRRLLREFEIEYTWRVMKLAGGNVSEAARLAQIDRKHLWRILQRTGIRVHVESCRAE
jgi:DNA-binding NtrC family response regulator